ncbi:MAG: hypothetical protein DK305_000908 [Chloroflexi bacterium]|jgi:hypothetical protein|nr:MAG: hypothetical protein DK305_000908 [Chloroflexota bacterium]|tara:strand:+ start:2529 stop:2738 length:210 start_codon:yes stop_codon:yes gene_type:complete
MSKDQQYIDQNNVQKIKYLSESWGIEINSKTINSFATKQTFMIDPSQLDTIELDSVRPISNLLWHLDIK